MKRCMPWRAGLVGALVAGFSSWAMAQSVPPPRDWLSTLEREHPLAGKVWSSARAGPIGLEELVSSLASVPLILLGEVHDNPDHHTLRGWAIGEIARRRQGAGAATRGAAVFEHIRTDQSEALARFRSGSATELLAALDWKSSGWPAADMFVPLFEPVLRAGLPIYPANPPRQQVRAVARGDTTVLDAAERARLRIDQPLPEPLASLSAAELKDSHCGMLPDAAIAPMIEAQRYRDATFADAMLKAAEKHHSAILLTGNGHVRRDRGVPWYLHERRPDLAASTVLLLEVEHAQVEPAAYVPRDPSGADAADFVVFTPRAARPDPCAAMAADRARKKN
jgi:uncharacterized iron-regulated protein